MDSVNNITKQVINKSYQYHDKFRANGFALQARQILEEIKVLSYSFYRDLSGNVQLKREKARFGPEDRPWEWSLF